MLNQDLYRVEFSKLYHPLYLIDLRSYQLKCQMKNTILFLLEDPRVNIDLVSGYFEFYYQTAPDFDSLGQVFSKALISYRALGSGGIGDLTSCVLFTKGMTILELLIYMPIQTQTYLQELKYYFIPKLTETCVVCWETKKNIINVHQDQYNHYVCVPCLLKCSRCPICRSNILS